MDRFDLQLAKGQKLSRLGAAGLANAPLPEGADDDEHGEKSREGCGNGDPPPALAPFGVGGHR